MATDGGEQQLADFVVDHGVASLQHINSHTHPTEVNELLRTYPIAGVPSFVIINQDGHTETQVGWGESGVRRYLDWATAN